MRRTPSLLSLPGSLWSRVVGPDRVLYMGQIEVLDISTVYYAIAECFGIKLFLHLAVCKQKTVYLC